MPHLTILLLTGSHIRRHSLTHFIPTRRSSHPQILRLSLPHLTVTDLDSPTPLTNTDPHTITPAHLNVLPCPLHTRLILGHSHTDATKTHTHTLAQTHEGFLRKTSSLVKLRCTKAPTPGLCLLPETRRATRARALLGPRARPLAPGSRGRPHTHRAPGPGSRLAAGRQRRGGGLEQLAWCPGADGAGRGGGGGDRGGGCGSPRHGLRRACDPGRRPWR